MVQLLILQGSHSSANLQSRHRTYFQVMQTGRNFHFSSRHTSRFCLQAFQSILLKQNPMRDRSPVSIQSVHLLRKCSLNSAEKFVSCFHRCFQVRLFSWFANSLSAPMASSYGVFSTVGFNFLREFEQWVTSIPFTPSHSKIHPSRRISQLGRLWFQTIKDIQVRSFLTI